MVAVEMEWWTVLYWWTSTVLVDIVDMKHRERQSGNATYSKDLDKIEIAPTNEDGPSTSHRIQNFEDQDRSGLEPLEQTTDSDEHQTLKHTVLLIILLGSVFVELAVFIWTLVMEKMSGVYWELSFLDVFLNFGQGLIVLAVFITDVGELLMPIVRIWRKLWHGATGVTLPHWSNLKPETKHICEQFRNHHLENCKKDIPKDRRWRFQVYRQVFYGSEFVSWLIEVGLSSDRLEAKHLVDGRVLRHINNVYHFEDKLLLYNLCGRN